MTLITVGICLIIVMMLIGVPVGYSFGAGALLIILVTDVDPRFALPAAFATLLSFALLAIPLFIMAGLLMGSTGISLRLIDFTNSIVGRMKGGLGIVMVVSCAVFGAISGSAASALAAIGSVMLPEMDKQGYPRNYSASLISVSCVLALLIPPSVNMIIFGYVSGISIAACFLANAIPGVIMVITYSIVHLVLCRKMAGLAVSPKVSFRTQIGGVGRATFKAFPALMMPIIILGGIYGGVFTPTEAGAVAAIYAIVVGGLVYRELTLKRLVDTLVQTARYTGMIMFMLLFLLLVSRLLVMNQVPQGLTAFFMGISENKYIILLILNIILLIMGMIMDDTSAIILAGVILSPIAKQIGVSPYQFAAIVGVNLTIGLNTPPVAPILYLAAGISGVSVMKMLKSVTIFLVFAALPVVFLTTYVPEISLLLPRLIMGIGA